jgi:alanine-glyoxylate transaminase / serine-glyoxylate transaminase / serine-pyruvate transaminase
MFLVISVSCPHTLMNAWFLQVPEGVDAVKVITNAMDKYKVEIAGGLGPSLGKVWRVGILGYNAQPQNIQLVLDVFRDGLKQQGKL